MSVFEQRESAIRAYCRVYPVVFEKALNARQTDENGHEYIDFFAGAGVLNFGHNNPRMTEAVVEYIQSNGVLHSLDMHTTAKRDFMTHFVRTVLEPRDMPHRLQFMGPTGTNAVEAAMKLARRATGRQDIVAFSHGFHGMTLGALSATANQVFRNAAGVPLNHVQHFAFGCTPRCPGCELGCGEESLERLRAQYQDSSSGVMPPAAFLVETIQAEGGVKVADKAWIEALGRLAKEVGALLIIDDIQVGVGRTGSFFSFDDLDIDPDIICLAKGIGGLGTPLAMNLVKPEIDDLWAPGEHTGTFRGQNISFIAGDVALSYFDDDALMQTVHANSRAMFDAVEPLAERHEAVHITGKGMIAGIDVSEGPRAKAIVSQCFEKGLLVSACGTGGRVVKVIPPLTIPEADLQQGLKTLVEVVDNVMKMEAAA